MFAKCYPMAQSADACFVAAHKLEVLGLLCSVWPIRLTDRIGFAKGCENDISHPLRFEGGGHAESLERARRRA